MNYILLLTDSELKDLYKIISGKKLKELYRRNPKEFAGIKPGFRASTLSDNEAISLAVEYRNKLFISDAVNSMVETWIQEIRDQLNSYEAMSIDQVTADILANSVFSDHIELYFKLAGEKVTEEYLRKIKEYMLSNGIKSESIAESLEDKDSLLCKLADLKLQLEECKKQLEEKNAFYVSELEKLQEENSKLQIQLSVQLQKIQDIQYQKQEVELELLNLRTKMQSDEEEDLFIDFAAGFEYVSLCEVSNPDYNGKKYLYRLADINKNGCLEMFCCNENKPKYFGNRPRLFFKDGSVESGTVAVWNWTPVPNKADLSRDFVEPVFNSGIMPVEIIIFQECRNTKELSEKLKEGIQEEISTFRVVFAVCVSAGKFTGVLCSKKDFESGTFGIKLSNNIISLPRYEFEIKDIIRLSNGKSYFRNVNIGSPVETINVKMPLDIVKSIILSRSSWQSFKQMGKTRSEWKKIKEFFEQLDPMPIIDDIVAAINCSQSAARELLDNFISHVNSYIDGITIEDEIICAIVSKNDILMDRCKALITKEWEEENREAINRENANLNELKEKIEISKSMLEKQLNEGRDQIEKQIVDGEKRLLQIQQNYMELQSKLQSIEEVISTKEQLATDVEKEVAERIKKAQADAAEFIANMAFVMPQIVIEERNQQPSKLDVTESRELNDEQPIYIPGVVFDSDGLEENRDWIAALDIIEDGLIKAGVMGDYARALAAYLYAAFLNHSPILMIGPNSNAIIDAFAAALFGRRAGVFDCRKSYNSDVVFSCLSGEDRIVKIVNPFNSNWISRIPDMINDSRVYFFVVHPYMEDIQIEPKSLYTYMLPLFTEPFIEKKSSGDVVGGIFASNYKDFQLVKVSRSHTKILTKLHMPTLIKNQIQILLNNMHLMLKNQNVDFDILFILLPYAYATMQMPVLLEAIQNTEKREISISKNLFNLIMELYGDYE